MEQESSVSNGSRNNGSTGGTTLLTVLIVLAVLHFARTVVIPLALAVLLAFLLAPLVIRLRHLGLGRGLSTICVVVLFFAFLSVIGLIMSSQLADLARVMPEYQTNIHKKVESVRKSGGGVLRRLSHVVSNVSEELNPAPPPNANNGPPETRPVPVEIRRSPFSPFELIQKILGSLVSIVVTVGIVIVFVIFMLIEQEDLRDRVIRLGGAERITETTRLLDDAAHRVSRYLLAQLFINLAFGTIAGITLYLIHIPNPLLWGMLAALLRYIPYLGVWIAALMPAAVALAVDPSWIKVPVVFGCYFGIDLLMYNFVEPLLYGNSTGISPLAILVAAVFWTWLWGPVGLLLATPLTVCVVVIGRHVPNLGFLQVLLSDEQVLAPATRLYQRLLAADLEEATAIAEESMKGRSLEVVFDEVIVPALALAEEDRHRGKLDMRRQSIVFQNLHILTDDLAERADELISGNNQRKVQVSIERTPAFMGQDTEASVLCVPARDEADGIAAFMLAKLFVRSGVKANAVPGGILSGESLETVAQAHGRVVCILAVPPFGYVHLRYMCRRLRNRFPELRLIAAMLTERDVAELRNRRPSVVCDEIASSLKQALTQAHALLTLESSTDDQPATAQA